MAQSRTWCVALLFVCLAAPAAAQEAVQEESQEETSLRPRFRFGLEAKAHYRDSEENRFQTPFPPLPAELRFEETVNAGSHFEISTVTLLLDGDWGDGLTAHGKIDFIDLYDRNPTSTDKEIDVDEAWVRFGIEPEPAVLAPRSGVYLKIGKMPKFERQDDRHLESYGLISTAFNRFEDTGAELGVSLGRHIYAKVTATQGNPVFMRDPNALAGDNGTPGLQRTPTELPPLKSGVVILYDAEVEDLDVDGDLELGGGLGVRFADEAGRNGLDVLVWSYQRTLAETVALEGTFYGGDLDLLNGPFDPPMFSLPIRGDKKEEVGANLWLYRGGLSVFAQYVDQELAGLPRTGIEAEVSWRFDLPLWLVVGERQLFPWIAPAVRWSKLENDFANPQFTPSPSLNWDWEKIDAGVRLGVFDGIDLTLEHADNRFILGNGSERTNNELLATLRWRS